VPRSPAGQDRQSEAGKKGAVNTSVAAQPRRRPGWAEYSCPSWIKTPATPRTARKWPSVEGRPNRGTARNPGRGERGRPWRRRAQHRPTGCMKPVADLERPAPQQLSRWTVAAQREPTRNSSADQGGCSRSSLLVAQGLRSGSRARGRGGPGGSSRRETRRTAPPRTGTRCRWRTGRSRSAKPQQSRQQARDQYPEDDPDRSSGHGEGDGPSTRN